VISTTFLVYCVILLLQFHRSQEDSKAFEGFARYLFRPFLVLIFTTVSLLCSRIFILIILINAKVLYESEHYSSLRLLLGGSNSELNYEYEQIQ
jgi:hypothetical protein